MRSLDSLLFYNATLSHKGLLTANVDGETLVINGGTLLLDGGEIRTENGGDIAVNGVALTAQNDGVFSIGDDSALTLSNVDFSGTQFLANDNDNDLSNNLVRILSLHLTVDDVLNTATMEVLRSNGGLRIDGSFVNDGNIVMDPAGAGSAKLKAVGAAQLLGSGKLQMRNASSHILLGDTNIAAAPDTLIHGADHTIEGVGIIGRILERFENFGLIHATLGGIDSPMSLEVGRETDFFINQPGGVLHADTNDIVVTSTPTTGHRMINRGVIDVESGRLFDLGINSTLSTIGDGILLHEAGELRIDGILEAEQMTIESGSISGNGTLRFNEFSVTGPDVVISPNAGNDPIGSLSVVENEPTSAFSACTTNYGPFMTGTAMHLATDQFDFGNATLKLDIESFSRHDAIVPGGHVLMKGNPSLELYYTGPAGGLAACSPGDPLLPPSGCPKIVLVENAVFRHALGVLEQGNDPLILSNPCGSGFITGSLFGTGLGITSDYLQGTGSFTPGIYPTSEDRLTGLIRTVDGRVTFKMVSEGLSNGHVKLELSYNKVWLTEPVMAAELTPQSYSFSVPGSPPTIGSTVTTVTKPASMTGTPRFSLIGDSPFAIDKDTGEITLAEAIDTVNLPASYSLTINVFDEDSVQINPTSIVLIGPDADGDGIGDATDNCRNAANPGQEDSNGNGIGDACEPDPLLCFPLVSGTQKTMICL